VGFIITTQLLLYSSTHSYTAAHGYMLLYTATYCPHSKIRMDSFKHNKEKKEKKGVSLLCRYHLNQCTQHSANKENESVNMGVIRTVMGDHFLSLGYSGC
jgi:hypothetical protein